jgi:hypothetical protein
VTCPQESFQEEHPGAGLEVSKSADLRKVFNNTGRRMDDSW